MHPTSSDIGSTMNLWLRGVEGMGDPPSQLATAKGRQLERTN